MQPSSFDRRPTTNDQRPAPAGGLWTLGNEPSGAASGGGLTPPSPSAWDDPAEEDAPEPGESVALQEWYRYIDSLARPSRRAEPEDEEPEATPLSWGLPWTPPPAEGLDDEVAEEIVAQLATEAAPEARVEWQPSESDVPVPDLTEFIPVQQAAPETASSIDVGQLTASPRPEPLRTESLGTTPARPRAAGTRAADAPGAAQSAAPPPAVALVPVSPVRTTEVVIRSVRERSEPETQRRDRAATPKETPGEAGKDSLPSIHEIRQQLPRQMERLLRVPTSEVAQHSYKSPFKETREELIQRLLDPCLTLEEAARLLGVCPTTVRRYTNRGLLRHQRTVGNQRRFRLSHVLEFLDEHGGTWRLDQAAEGDAEGSASGRSEDGSKTVH